MNRIETKIVIMVSGRLAKVPDSDEKMDLIEELSENLYQRYLDLAAEGLGEDDALAQTMDSLGDVDELLAYLREVQEQQEEAGPSFEKKEEEKTGRTERGCNFSFHRDWGSELEGLGEKIGSAVNAAMDMTMDAVDSTWDFVRDVSRQVKERYAEGRGAAAGETEQNGQSGEGAQTGPAEEPEESAQAGPAEEPEESAQAGPAEGLEEGAQTGTAGGPEEAMQPKAACEAQGDGNAETAEGPEENAQTGTAEGLEEGAQARAAEDAFGREKKPGTQRTLSFQAREIHSLECRLGNGDICIHLAPEESDEITLVGDTGELETVLRDGTLRIRQGRTVSASLLFSWGMRASDVELTIPAKRWEKLTVITANGDVEIDGKLQCADLTVQSKNGDFHMDTAVCGRTRIQLSRGDIAVAAATGDFRAETRSGDIAVGGNLFSCLMRTVSGDVSFRGSVAEAGSLAAYSVSGDIDLRTELLPQKVRLSSTSGDCRLRIPQNIGFRLFTRTVSGDFESNLPLRSADEKGTEKIYLNGGDREITISTVSGDISLYTKDTSIQE